jgi:hypothetical protein
MKTSRYEQGPLLGPHAIGAERFATVSSGSSFAQAAGPILRKQARVQNPDEVPRSRPAGGRQTHREQR